MNVNKVDKTNFTSRPVNAGDLAELKAAIKKGQAFLYDVDTTIGFMHPNVTRPDGTRDGLYVPKAEAVISAMAKIKQFTKGIIAKFETVDAHKKGDPELQWFAGEPFNSDIHSEKGTLGGTKISETVFGEPNALIEVEPEKNDVPSVSKIQEILASKGIIRLEKNENDSLKYGIPFTNQVVPNKKGLAFFENLKKAGAKVALVYGVATDYCVKDAVAALKKFGIKPIVIEDAIKEFGQDSTKIADDAVYHDVAIMTTEQLGKVLNKVQTAESALKVIK
ncbi:MAG: isochorismatase family protein [Candidatus Gastranaerophilaceae bacterium]